MAAVADPPAAALAFAEVAVGARLGSELRTFHYFVPAGLRAQAAPGTLVRVPFGTRVLAGVVVGRSDVSPVEGNRELLEVVDATPVLTPAQVALAGWLARMYACSLAEALAVMLPPGLLMGAPRARAKRVRVVRPLEPSGAVPPGPRRAPAQARVLEHVRAHPGQPLAEVLRATATTASTVEALAARGLVAIDSVTVRRDPLQGRAFQPTQALEPTAGQARALERLLRRHRAGGEGFLLHGVTASGKTEVYLQVIERCVAEGGRAIVLVPELSLTPQAVSRFSARFPGRVAVLHGALSAGERLDEWERIRRGEVDVVVGSRTALFAPLPSLRVIVVDEEHDASYKSPRAPRYHARETAVALGRLAGAQVLLGSATPDVATYYHALQGCFHLLHLPERVRSLPLPPVQVVDMRQELRAGNRGLFSRALHQALYRTLEQRQQAVLFLNRRGNAASVLCRDCGRPVACRRCELALSYHSAGHRLVCHLCGNEQFPMDNCPSCMSPRIAPFGFGTQRVEAEVRRLFPRARVLRLDRDAAATKGAHERILDAFSAREADVLVGTQMVAKGHDLPLVTLVGVVSADVGLHLPDFRASERTFQLLTQVAGRAGRALPESQVVVQTYNPEHVAVQMAAAHDYAGFYQREIAWRRELGHPPFARMVRFVCTAAKEETCRRKAHEFHQELLRRTAEAGEPACELLGPAPCPVLRMRGKYRWQIVARGENVTPLLTAIPSGWSADVDPVSWL